MRNKLAKQMIMVLSVVCFSSMEQAVADEWLMGSVSIRNKADQKVYAEHLSIFLVSAKNPVSAEGCLSLTDRQRRLDCLNNRHLEFYKRFQEKHQEAGYLIAQTVTSATGRFALFDVPAGTYYVLVKFPSMIDGYKVAWQEPVNVVPNRISVVSLDDDNLVLPKHRRR